MVGVFINGPGKIKLKGLGWLTNRRENTVVKNIAGIPARDLIKLYSPISAEYSTLLIIYYRN